MARTVRLCDSCFQVDDHPRHVKSVASGGVPSQEELARVPEGTPIAAVIEVLDPATTVKHISCCAAAGCTSCQTTVNNASGATGADLTNILTAAPPAPPTRRR